MAACLLLVATALYAPARWRSSVRILGGCLVFAVTSLILRPFVHPVPVAVTTTPAWPRATVVSGGILPTHQPCRWGLPLTISAPPGVSPATATDPTCPGTRPAVG